ncbi:MAG: DMT family transporter [Planctomycetota bacterium]|nr:DMT family transporter [Planctomycetota bacterium]MEC8511872.1 DMT family transporter [Planctomycetota bacterium]
MTRGAAGDAGLAATAVLTAVALIAFAGNSLLCRAALAWTGDGAAIGPVGFTAVRLLSGALALLPVAVRAGALRPAALRTRSGACALLVYAICFSVSYVTVPAGVGALLLFGAVQITMLVVARARGEAWTLARLVGLACASGGVLVLVGLPGAGDPVNPGGAALMIVAGIGWATYTLLGRSGAAPTLSTALNFAAAAPFALLCVLAAALLGEEWSGRGLLLAATSGAVTSGLGYAIWYAALRGHSRTSAAAVQLTVPLIAAAGGVVLLGERATPALAVAAVLILGGVGLTLARPRIAAR